MRPPDHTSSEQARTRGVWRPVLWLTVLLASAAAAVLLMMGYGSVAADVGLRQELDASLRRVGGLIAEESSWLKERVSRITADDASIASALTPPPVVSPAGPVIDRRVTPGGQEPVEGPASAQPAAVGVAPSAGPPERRTRAAAIAPPVGSLHINARPWADVWIDGKLVGTTPLANLQVPIGPHEVVWRHPQLGERRETVEVTPGAPVRIGMDLRQ